MSRLKESDVRTTINIDDELLERATQLAGPMDRTTLIGEGLKAFIERESARRLARLAGSERALKVARRRRSSPSP
jgi:predicted transcriptional regulator